MEWVLFKWAILAFLWILDIKNTFLFFLKIKLVWVYFIIYTLFKIWFRYCYSYAFVCSWIYYRKYYFGIW